LLRDAFERVGITGKRIERGEVYLVPDNLIVLPEERIPSRRSRTIHEERPVLILQTNVDNAEPLYLIVLVAPLSHRVDLKGEQDYRLKAGQGGLKQDSMVHLGLVQPILRTELQGDAIGKLDTLAMNDIDAILAANLGLIERHLPPKSS